jgi:hypothetical protein
VIIDCAHYLAGVRQAEPISEAADNAGGMAVGVGNKDRVNDGDRDSATRLCDVVT